MPVPPRYADTKIDADGRRVPASEFEEAEGAAKSTKIDPDTRIAADGTRKPMDEIDDNEVSPVGRTAESRFAEERSAVLAAATDEPAADEPDEPADEPADDEADSEGEGEDEDEEKALEDHTVAELKEIASELEIEGRSGMNKDELIAAIESARG